MSASTVKLLLNEQHMQHPAGCKKLTSRYASVEGGAGEEREEGAVDNLLKEYCRIKMIQMGL